MRQILFQISLDEPWDFGPLGKVQGFGFGLVLVIWIVAGIAMAISQYRAGQLKLSNALAPLIQWIASAAMIVYAAPAIGRYLHAHGTVAFREGIPVFGYGLMM